MTDPSDNVLEDGDAATIIKDLKADIDAKVPGFGQIQLKSSVVKKVV